MILHVCRRTFFSAKETGTRPSISLRKRVPTLLECYLGSGKMRGISLPGDALPVRRAKSFWFPMEKRGGAEGESRHGKGGEHLKGTMGREARGHGDGFTERTSHKHGISVFFWIPTRGMRKKCVQG